MSGVTATSDSKSKPIINKATVNATANTSRTTSARFVPGTSLLAAASPPASGTQSVTALIRTVIENPSQENFIALLRRCLAFFKAAFIDQPPSAGALAVWRELESSLEEAGLTSQQAIGALLMMADEGMSQSDRVMLYNFYGSQLDSSDGISAEIKERIIECYRDSSLGYNSWAGTNYRSPSDLFLDFFMAYLGNGDYLMFISQVLNENINGKPAVFSVLTTMPPNQVQKYLVQGLSPQRENKLLEELFINWQFAQREWQNAPTGSELKTRAYQRLKDWETIALARGCLLNLWYFNFQLTLPGLSQNEYHDLFTIQFYNQEYYQAGYLQILQRFVDKYRNSGVNSDRREVLAKVIEMLASQAGKFGVNQKTLENILAPIMVPGTQTISNLEALAHLGQDRVVSPEGLPQEIKDLLIATGNWELVRNNLLQIRFTKEINEGQGSFNMQNSGYALTSLAQVVIDCVDPQGNLTPIWDVAATLVHEAAHVAWQKQVAEITDPEAQAYFSQSLPHERSAAILELNFLKVFLKSRDGSLSAEEREMFQFLINDKTEQVIAANIVLGYGRSDFNPHNFNPPSDKVLDARGLYSANELDLETYISYQTFGTANDAAAIDLLLIEANTSQHSEEELARAAQLLKDVLKGKGYLELQFNGNLEGLQITMRYHNGTSCAVPENVALAINYLLQGTNDYTVLLSSEYSCNVGGKIRIQYRSTDLLKYLYYRD